MSFMIFSGCGMLSREQATMARDTMIGANEIAGGERQNQCV
jgi:hypothetical protein